MFDFSYLFDPFWANFVNLADLPIGKRPRLAHYSRLDVVSEIIRTETIWFSCPLFMNDYQEMLWGLNPGLQIFERLMSEREFVAQNGNCGTHIAILDAYRSIHEIFLNEFALDVFVLCLSEHIKVDGLLSMWRAYGANGSGAAMVFQTDFVGAYANSPLLIGKVIYASDAQRVAYLEQLVITARNVFVGKLVTVNQLTALARATFEAIKIYSLLSKNVGFEEEGEWRVLYLPERDSTGVLKKYVDFVVTRSGVQPKLKFPIQPMDFEVKGTWTFNDIVDHVLLGPTHQTPLALDATKRMFLKLGKPQLSQTLRASGIPLRPSLSG